MSLHLHILASSSTANAAVLQTPNSLLLIDAGLPKRVCFRRMAEAGLSPDDITAVILSHEHGDHAGHAEVIAGALGIPIYATAGTISGIKWKGSPDLRVFRSGARFSVDDVEIAALPIPHDAAESVGFRFAVETSQLAIINDLGRVPSYFAEALAGCDFLMLEANFQPEMLVAGDYPAIVKRRVLSPTGHLSNAGCAEFLKSGLSARTRQVVLSHLSRRNNTPEIATLMAQRALGKRDCSLTIAPASEVVSFSI